jgi:hypothetical protein
LHGKAKKGNQRQVSRQLGCRYWRNSMATKIDKTTLNAICPYFTMFPLDFPLNILESKGQDGEWVMDPFCGRGTTNYAARIAGLNTAGIDSNPVAVAIAQAKQVSCTPEEVIAAAKQLLEEVVTPQDVPVGEFWDWAYHPTVLNHICRIREGLLHDCGSEQRIALRAIMLGALHGHVLKTTASYFSNQCQRTYSPKPDYAVRFWKQKDMKAPLVDVIAVIQKRVERFFSCLPSSVSSLIIQGDSRQEANYTSVFRDLRVDWIITSPPYYGMKSYLPDQWLRLWFMGSEPVVNYDKSTQLRHSGAEVFSSEMRQVWMNVRRLAKPTTQLIVRFGGLPSVKSDPVVLLKKSFSDSGWKLDKYHSAGFSSDGHRQAYQQAKNQNPPVEEFDFWASVDM